MSRRGKWEWALVICLLGGLGLSAMVPSSPANPKKQATDLAAQMKAAAMGRPLGPAIFGTLPVVQRNKSESVVTIIKIPPKVCVLASWDLYRLGVLTINGVTPTRVSAAKLVELCNEAETATLTWTAKPIS